VLWIRIRISFGGLDPDSHWECVSGSRQAKMTHKKEHTQKLYYFEVLGVPF
jgi:hypothetical protein